MAEKNNMTALAADQNRHEAPGPRAKREYRRPTVTRNGGLEVLTQGVGGAVNDGLGSQVM